MSTHYVIPTWDVASLPVAGSSERFPVRRIFCVGRNYLEHQKEMGSTEREEPFFFCKAPHGLVAVNDVSIELTRGDVHAVIGTNGAGKSTLINILSGEIPPSSGTVELLGQDATTWSQPKRARAGLGRSYQRNTIYPSFTVLEN